MEAPPFEHAWQTHPQYSCRCRHTILELNLIANRGVCMVVFYSLSAYTSLHHTATCAHSLHRTATCIATYTATYTATCTATCIATYTATCTATCTATYTATCTATCAATCIAPLLARSVCCIPVASRISLGTYI